VQPMVLLVLGILVTAGTQDVPKSYDVTVVSQFGELQLRNGFILLTDPVSSYPAPPGPRLLQVAISPSPPRVPDIAWTSSGGVRLGLAPSFGFAIPPQPVGANINRAGIVGPFTVTAELGGAIDVNAGPDGFTAVSARDWRGPTATSFELPLLHGTLLMRTRDNRLVKILAKVASGTAFEGPTLMADVHDAFADISSTRQPAITQTHVPYDTLMHFDFTASIVTGRTFTPCASSAIVPSPYRAVLRAICSCLATARCTFSVAVIC